MPPIKVFISHRWAEGEHEFAKVLAGKLSNYHGIDVLLDEFALLPGDDIRDWMLRAVTSSDIVIFILSPQSVASNNCKFEIKAALNSSIPIIPVLLRDYKVPRYLAGKLYADFRDAMDTPPHKVEQLVRAIRKHANDPEKTVKDFTDPYSGAKLHVSTRALTTKEKDPTKPKKRSWRATFREAQAEPTINHMATYLEGGLFASVWVGDENKILNKLQFGQEYYLCVEVENGYTIPQDIIVESHIKGGRLEHLTGPRSANAISTSTLTNVIGRRITKIPVVMSDRGEGSNMVIVETTIAARLGPMGSRKRRGHIELVLPVE